MSFNSEENGNQMRKAVKYRMQRLTFHNAALSKVAAGADDLRACNGRHLTPYMMDILSHFVPEERRSDEEDMKRLMHDLRFSRAFYASSYREYFLFDFEKRSVAEKRDYVCWVEQNDYYRQLNAIGRPEIFENKTLTAQHFGSFYLRDTCTVFCLSDKDSFICFLEKHGRAILKPLEEFGGKGVTILELGNGNTPDDLWRGVSHRIPFLMEELIRQSPEIGKYYPVAVNTIRYNTFYHAGKMTRLQAVFRIGRGGSVVDNATAGGLYSLVDTETGEILNPARTFQGELFTCHPDTGVKLQGSFLPRWGELNDLLEQLARVVPEQKQVGWDLALSTDGWVMVEANTRPALQRFDMAHGLRPLMKQTFGTAIPMWE